MSDDKPGKSPKALGELVNESTARPADLTDQERALAKFMQDMGRHWLRLLADTTPVLVEHGVHPDVALGSMLEVAIACEAKRRGPAALAVYLRRAADVIEEQGAANISASH